MLSNDTNNYNNKPRKGSKDLWNASLLKGASYTEDNDIPICFTCNGTVPHGIINFEDAKALHKN